jgi:small subunit ribosomal protein S6
LAVSADQRNEYELVLMLDPEAADERRDEIAMNARQRIEENGALKAEGAWGMRKLAYEIRQRNEADYRFYRFQGEAELLERLDHSLKITDGVLRFRIFKVDPDAPANPPPSVERPAAVGDGRPDRGDRERRPRRDDHDE